jgi:uncharacterized protein YjbK
MAQEVELKLVLTQGPDALAKVASLLAPLALQQADVQLQTNFYFDNKDLQLRAARAMLRVRRTLRQDGSERYHLTAKLRPSLHSGVLSSTEHERELLAIETSSWQSGPPAQLLVSKLDTQGWLRELLEPAAAVQLLGAMHNQRQAVVVPLQLWLPERPLDARLTVELDQTELAGCGVRCEIELEHPEAAALARGLCAWLDLAGVAWSLAQESKYAWFLRLTEASSGTVP